MTDDAITLLESAIHITKERDKRSLGNALVETIADYLDFHSVSLFNVPPMENAEHLELASFVSLDETQSRNYQRPDIEAPYDDLIRKAIDRRDVVSETIDDISRTIFPIVVYDKVVSLLVINHHSQQKPNRKLIQGFLRIYGNFIAILNDNERDTLTGLLNRKTFDTLIGELLNNLPENEEPLKDSSERRETAADTFHWLGLLDIDHFKSINDNFGHLYGDEVLMMFANIISNSFRKHDLIFRYGGEEFVVALTKASEKNAIMVFERFRHKLEAFEFPQVGKVTVSIGIAKILPNTHPSLIMEQADKALYHSKNNGRNQLSNYHHLLQTGKISERTVDSHIELF